MQSPYEGFMEVDFYEYYAGYYHLTELEIAEQNLANIGETVRVKDSPYQPKAGQTATVIGVFMDFCSCAQKELPVYGLQFESGAYTMFTFLCEKE